MEIKEKEFYVSRTSPHSRFDKRLILKIVGQVEAGLPRKEANRIYGLGKSTLHVWMRKYGSPDYHQNKRGSFTNLQKRTIVAAIEQGRMSVREAQSAYRIKSEESIKSWLAQSKSEKAELCSVTEPAMAKKTKPISPAQGQALQKALEEAEMKIKALNTLIDVAEEQLKIDIRKKSGARQSSK
jgi:transposase-like protein